jgi:hypothetical protein
MPIIIYIFIYIKSQNFIIFYNLTQHLSRNLYTNIPTTGIVVLHLYMSTPMTIYDICVTHQNNLIFSYTNIM